MTGDKRKRIEELTVDIESSILSTLKRMDTFNTKLLMVNKDNKFYSLLSIGDIQRSIINNIDINSSSIAEILRPKAKLSVCSTKDGASSIKEKIIEQRIEFMPVLNENEELDDVIFWEELLENKSAIRSTDKINVPVVIMAGGEGKRLYPITKIIPKPLVPVGDKPIIEQIINNFTTIGATEFYISVNYKAEMIAHHFEQLPDKKYDTYFFTEEKPLGTAGSLFLLKNKINTTFFLTNCDILIDQDFSEVYNYHKENGNKLTLIGAVKHLTIPYGTVETKEQGRLFSLIEKPEFTYTINTGVYILEPSLLESIPENKFFHITDLIQKLIDTNEKVGVFPISEGAWLDIGEWKEYLITQQRFEKRFGK